MQASSQDPVRSDVTIVFKFRDAERFARTTGSQCQKPSRRTTKKLLILPQVTPPKCPSMKQSQSRNQCWSTKPPKLIWTLGCTDHCKTCPLHPSQGGERDKKHDITYILENIFIKHCFLPPSSSQTASAACLHHPRGGAAALPTTTKPGQKAAVQDSPERPAQFQIMHRIALPRGISGWDQTRRHVPQVSNTASVSSHER